MTVGVRTFTKIRDVVEYFNAGVPQHATAGTAPTLSIRFTNPGRDAGLKFLDVTSQMRVEVTDSDRHGFGSRPKDELD
jgi:hypothetical protein